MSNPNDSNLGNNDNGTVSNLGNNDNGTVSNLGNDKVAALNQAIAILNSPQGKSK